MKKILLLAFVGLTAACFSQPSTPSTFGIKFSGFIRSDIFMDTHENTVMRDGMIDLYPEAPSYDIAGNDLYEKLSFNFLCFSTRFRANITGPDAFGAKTTGLIEGEFFGTSDADINGFRMRHAHINLNWKSTELRIGQAWHPMFVPECFPQTVSFSTGSPFNVFNRSPQIRVTQQAGRAEIVAAILTERDFQTNGPDPADHSKSMNSTQFIRNSGMPEFQVLAKLKLDSAGKYMIGGGIGTKCIKPELYSIGTSNTKRYSAETVRSFSGFGFVKLAFNPIEIRMVGIYCQNAYDLTMLGGYAVKEILNAVTGERTFTPISTFSYWADMQYVGKNWKTGFFTGYTSNLGASEELSQKIYYARGSNIAYVYRFAPRFTYTSGKLDVSFELEYTVAAYGTITSKAKVEDAKEIKNIRPLLVSVYNF